MFLRRWDPGIQREEQNGLDHHQEGSIGKIRKRQGVLGRRYNLGSRWILLQKGNMETERSQKSSRSVEWIEISIIIQAKAQNQGGGSYLPCHHQRTRYCVWLHHTKYR
ncbi:Uncharacterized protein Rs2_41240 [Raphanus sativus]|nr:Uncharacterized protein Rs2_41240 [Raphanus sativus]